MFVNLFSGGLCQTEAWDEYDELIITRFPTDELWLFDIEKLKWTWIGRDGVGSPPSPRFETEN